MPYVYREPTFVLPPISDLRVAVARWEYEGGAGPNGPQEGFRFENRQASPVADAQGDLQLRPTW